MANIWLEVRVKLRNHHKLVSSATTLELPKPHLLGHLVSLWLGALEFAEDGDLWRGTDESSYRFVAALSEITLQPEKFVEVMRIDRWFDDWLIHDWLDYAGKYLISKYKTHGRNRLVQIWTKHGRIYGREQNGESETTSQGNQSGSGGVTYGEASGMRAGSDSDHPPSTLYPKPSTLDPYALGKRNETALRGGLGENAKECGNSASEGKTGLLISDLRGNRVQGFSERQIPVYQSQLTGDALPLKDVFEAFMPLLVFHGILTLEAFHKRIQHCRTTPSRWMMLFLDKIHAVYRDRDGSTLIEDDDADPVAMTVAGLTGRSSGIPHVNTEAARQLFIEIMLDYDKAKKGGKSVWAGRTSGPSIAIELTRRKGSASRVRT